MTFSTPSVPIYHLGLYIQRNNSSTRPHEPGKSEAEISQATANIHDRLPGSDEAAKNRNGIVN